MNRILYISAHNTLIIIFTLILNGCYDRNVDELVSPGFPAKSEIFIDDFSSDLIYAAFGGSDVKAFQIDNKETYGNSKASMRFSVPDANSAVGAYAGGSYFSKTGRDLSGFNALTFYIKATQFATIDVLGFGNDFGASKYQIALNGLAINTNWQKVIIPIPDASKLTSEKGLFYYSTGPINEKGYTFWIDEVQFEKVPDLGRITGSIFNGEQRNNSTAEKGSTITIDGNSATVNLPSGVNRTIQISPSYFTFESSNPKIATVSSTGIITVLDSGSAIITATLGNTKANGSLTLASVANTLMPEAPAPIPNVNSKDVISLYSNAYTNVPIDSWNTHWKYSTTENSFIKINNDDIIKYYNLNFVGIEFSANQINASSMTHFHIDIWTPNATNAPNNVKVMLVDFGANGIYGGGDDVSHEITVNSPVLSSSKWISLDIPLSSFTGLKTKSHLSQLVLSGTVTNLYVDNIYLHK